MNAESGITFFGITELDIWLDSNVSAMYQEQPLAQSWARIAKIAEELGEATQAWIGVTGQNPRKGVTHVMPDVLDELCDTLFTCLLAIQHFTKDEAVTFDLIKARWWYRMNKAGLI